MLRIKTNITIVYLVILGLVAARIIDDPPPAAKPSNGDSGSGGLTLNSGKGILVLMLVIFCSLFAAIGGHSLIIAILIIFYGMFPHLANAHAAFFTFMVVLARLIHEINREPAASSSSTSFSGPRINWHIILVAAAPSLLGVLIGTYINEITPSLLLFILINVVMLALLLTTVAKLAALFKARGLEGGNGDSLEASRADVEDEEVEDILLSLRKSSGSREKRRREMDDKFKTIEYGNDDRPIRRIEPEIIRADEIQYEIHTKESLILLAIFLLNPIYLWLRGTAIAKPLIASNFCESGDISLFLFWIVIYGLLAAYNIWKVSSINSSKEKEDDNYEGDGAKRSGHLSKLSL